MRVVQFDHGLELAKPTEGYVRSPGLHASDLYGAFYKKADPKRYDKRDIAGNATPFDLLKMEVGTTFEELLEEALAARLLGQRPGEFTSPEGVIFSPDYLFYEPEEVVLGEFKLTWYSSRNAPFDEKFSKWITQVKLYCHWLDLRQCRLYALFVNADYKPPTPELLAWKITFTPRELADEWAMIERFAKKEGLL
jgi:hypothetical protein